MCSPSPGKFLIPPSPIQYTTPTKFLIRTQLNNNYNPIKTSFLAAVIAPAKINELIIQAMRMLILMMFNIYQNIIFSFENSSGQMQRGAK